MPHVDEPRLFDPRTIRSIHLELTTRCNARCPMCARTGRGTTRDGLAMVDLSIDDIRHIFPAEFLSRIERIDLCGAFGDPLVAVALDDILEHFRRNGPDVALHIYTNGSLRSKAWWQRLPDRLGPRHKLYFGLDGLADTHATYRVGTNFSTILRNAAAFIRNGGRAQWDFLVFRHNQHQVDAARALAHEIGFETFSVKASGRFFRRLYEEMPGLDAKDGYELFPVFGAKGQRLYELEPADRANYSNASVALMQSIAANEGSLQPTFDRSAIRCLSVDRGSYFVSAEATVFPCCWTYIASKYETVFGMRDADNLRIARLLEANGGPSAIDARHHAIADILAGPFFRALGESWQAPSVADGKPKICARTCGGCFSPKDAYAEASLSPYATARIPTVAAAC